MHRRLVWAVVALAAGALACGGGGSSYPTSSGNNGNPGGNGGSPPPAPGPSADVTIADYSFTPSTITVKVGTSVMWSNAGSVAHTVTADDGSFTSGQLAGSGGGGGYGGGGGTTTYSRTFSTAGTFNYHCANHSTMTASVTVTP